MMIEDFLHQPPEEDQPENRVSEESLMPAENFDGLNVILTPNQVDQVKELIATLNEQGQSQLATKIPQAIHLKFISLIVESAPEQMRELIKTVKEGSTSPAAMSQLIADINQENPELFATLKSQMQLFVNSKFLSPIAGGQQ